MLVPEAPVRLSLGKQRRLIGTPHEYEWESTTDYLADFISVTDAGYATEYEVKVSRADWLADLKKPKWTSGFPGYISKFVYVVPQKLGIPEWVPPAAGVWHLVDSKRSKFDRWDDTHVVVARQPQRIGKEKVPDKVLELWRRAFYYRFWRLRIDLDRRIWERKDLQFPEVAA